MTIPTLFDRRLLRARQQRSEKTLEQADFLLEAMASRLAERLQDVKRDFPLALEMGSRGRLCHRSESAQGKIGRVIRMGLTSERPVELVGDEEALPFAPDTFDLILCTGNLHRVNDLPGTLKQCADILKPDGLFLAIFPGGQTLHELRNAMTHASLAVDGGASPRIYPFVDVRDAGTLLQRAGFALPVVDSERLEVRYTDPLKLLNDLKQMGESSVLASRSRHPITRHFLQEISNQYRIRCENGGDGRVPATFELITLSAWKPHASQPKPARRGSGQVSLTEVFGGDDR